MKAVVTGIEVQTVTPVHSVEKYIVCCPVGSHVCFVNTNRTAQKSHL